jgi:hypothetical protein
MSARDLETFERLIARAARDRPTARPSGKTTTLYSC